MRRTGLALLLLTGLVAAPACARRVCCEPRAAAEPQSSGAELDAGDELGDAIERNFKHGLQAGRAALIILIVTQNVRRTQREWNAAFELPAGPERDRRLRAIRSRFGPNVRLAVVGLRGYVRSQEFASRHGSMGVTPLAVHELAAIEREIERLEGLQLREPESP